MTKQMNKKGTSLVELIAVIVIMGIIAAVAVPTTISVIGRQRKKAAISSMEGCEAAAQTLLLEGDGSGVTEGEGEIAYFITVADLVTAGELKKDPITEGEAKVAYAISKDTSTTYGKSKILIGTVGSDNKFTPATDNTMTVIITNGNISVKCTFEGGVIKYTNA